MKIQFTTDEDNSVLNYIAQRAIGSKTPLNMTGLWRDYKLHTGSSRSIGSLHERYRSVLSQKLHKNEHFDMATKAKMLFATFVPLNEENMEMLREKADLIEVSERNVLLRYKNGELELSAYDEMGKLAGNLQCGESRSRTKRRKILEPIEPRSEPEDPNSLGYILKQLLKSVEATPPSARQDERLNVKGFMTHLQNLVIFVNSPMMENLKRKVERAMGLLENNEQFTTATRIHVAFESIFGLTFSCVAVDGSNEPTTPLIAFLGVFRMVTASYGYEELNELHAKIDRVVEKVANRNVEIPISNVRFALENAYFLVYNGE